MATPEDVADALDAAADLIEVHGWCQGIYEKPDGRLCVVGSIMKATPSNDLVCDARNALFDAIGRAPFNWNDEPGRTEFEVIDALRLTAKSLRPVELPDPHDQSDAEWLQEKAER